MRPTNITIDINSLDTDDLETLAGILYRDSDWSAPGYGDAMKAIQERAAFVRGTMSPKAEARYLEKLFQNA